MHYIVGLGNPGEKHEDTRHNVGFIVLKAFVSQNSLPSFHDSSAHSGLVSEGIYKGREVTILLPQTYMNASGSAVKKVVDTNSTDSLLVVYDDIDLPLGEIKISYGKGSGGHNGLQSVIDALKTPNFTRLRIGIGKKSFWSGKVVRPKGEKLSSYVLGEFTNKEKEELAQVIESTAKVIETFMTEGKDKVMNQFN